MPPFFELCRFHIALNGLNRYSARLFGEVSEWSKEHAWKVCVRRRTEGSNPSLTANLRKNNKNSNLEKNRIGIQRLDTNAWIHDMKTTQGQPCYSPLPPQVGGGITHFINRWCRTCGERQRAANQRGNFFHNVFLDNSKPHQHVHIELHSNRSAFRQY